MWSVSRFPPLRERKEDIVPLLNHFLTVVNQKYHTQKTIFSDTIDAFENYPWPGNVRELENVLENLVTTTPGDEIRRENLPKKFWSENGEPAAVGMREILPLKVTVERVELAAIQHAIDPSAALSARPLRLWEWIPPPLSVRCKGIKRSRSVTGTIPAA